MYSPLHKFVKVKHFRILSRDDVPEPNKRDPALAARYFRVLPPAVETVMNERLTMPCLWPRILSFLFFYPRLRTPEARTIIRCVALKKLIHQTQ